MSIQQVSHSDPSWYCTDCRSQGRPYQIIEIPAGPAKNWGGAPSHKKRCTGCGFEDGPWVKASHVGDY
jgi:hypothetical protein